MRGQLNLQPLAERRRLLARNPPVQIVRVDDDVSRNPDHPRRPPLLAHGPSRRERRPRAVRMDDTEPHDRRAKHLAHERDQISGRRSPRRVHAPSNHPKPPCIPARGAGNKSSDTAPDPALAQKRGCASLHRRCRFRSSTEPRWRNGKRGGLKSLPWPRSSAAPGAAWGRNPHTSVLAIAAYGPRDLGRDRYTLSADCVQAVLPFGGLGCWPHDLEISTN